MDEEERRRFLRQDLYLHLLHVYHLPRACFLNLNPTVFKELLFRAQLSMYVVAFLR